MRGPDPGNQGPDCRPLRPKEQHEPGPLRRLHEYEFHRSRRPLIVSRIEVSVAHNEQQDSLDQAKECAQAKTERTNNANHTGHGRPEAKMVNTQASKQNSQHARDYLVLPIATSHRFLHKAKLNGRVPRGTLRVSKAIKLSIR